MSKIKELNCTISDGNYSSKYPKRDEFVPFGIPFIRANNMKNNKIVEKDMYYITPTKHSELKKGHLKRGDVLLVSRGSIGLTAIVPYAYEDANVNAQIVIIRCDNKTIFNNYLLWNLNSQKVKNQLKSLETGSTLKQLPISSVNEINIVDRNYEEQVKISNELNKISEAIENRKAVIQDYKNLIISKFFEMFGDVINNTFNFDFKPIKDVCEIVSGTTPDTKTDEFWNGDINWITPAEIDEDDFLISDTQRKITKSGLEKSGLKLLPIGTVIFSSRAPIGKTAIANAEIASNQGFKNCICGTEINNVYLFYLLKINKDFFNAKGTGATFKELSKNVFGNIKISIPPLTKQKEFDNYARKIIEQKGLVEKDITDLESLLEVKMHEYFD